jgi:hypothetical protein
MRPLAASDLLVFTVVNVTNVAQTIAFLLRHANPGVQWAMGLLMIVMAIPAGVAVVLDSGLALPAWQRTGPLVFIAFAAFSLVVNHLLDIEFRQPRNAAVLVPFLVLFFGSILLMGLRLFPVSKPLWGVTAFTSAALVGSMIWAELEGSG